MGQLDGVAIPVDCPPPHYRAFISYSHRDGEFAVRLHRALESYRLPARLRDDTHAARLTPIFRDLDDLRAGGDLSAQVKAALADCAALIVVASPNAKASLWVAREIELFRARHPDRPILVALASGEPADGFPAPLLIGADGQAVEPLAADFRAEGDGPKLARLKLIAALADVPLDALVQRDAQRFMRRVMAVTVSALVLVLMLAGLLVMALRARTEAERQRAEAEGMVEFMLTDLRDKLKGVGRLDVMAAVNQRAMQHYADQDLSALPDDSLDKRARILQAMGEDDSASGNNQIARRDIDEAYRVSAALLARRPNDPQRQFTHAQSEYWAGYLDYTSHNPAGARVHWTAYDLLAKRMVEADPTNIRWIKERGYAASNLCTLALEAPIEAATAREKCGNAARQAEQVAAANRDDKQAVLDLANRYGWQADAYAKTGDAKSAMEIRQRQVDLVDAASRKHPSDAQLIEARLLARIGLARIYQQAGDTNAARNATAQGQQIAAALRAIDPENADWKKRQDQVNNLGVK